jgi:aminoglycoside phosphotransferase (APT) family kinase protein
MELIPIDRPSGDTLNTLTAEQILAMCQRAFGSGIQVVSARELAGGTFNRTFLVTLPDQQVILRIAPHPTKELVWHEKGLMRREHHIQPFFAAVAQLMPRTLLTDFTRQVIDCDYVFQSFITGERWEDVAESLTAPESARLWESFGQITRTIHDTVGTTFGGPYPMIEFQTWSETILYRFERVMQAMREAHLDMTDMRSVFAAVQKHTAVLNAVKQPCLLHGDLWLFNILIQRDSTGAAPKIAGILDADRAWWGDPLADWTMFVLAKSASPENRSLQDCFWRGYGEIEQRPGLEFRKAVYEAMHIGTALAWAIQNQDDGTVKRGKQDLKVVATRLPDLIR